MTTTTPTTDSPAVAPSGSAGGPTPRHLHAVPTEDGAAVAALAGARPVIVDPAPHLVPVRVDTAALDVALAGIAWETDEDGHGRPVSYCVVDDAEGVGSVEVQGSPTSDRADVIVRHDGGREALVLTPSQAQRMARALLTAAAAATVEYAL